MNNEKCNKCKTQLIYKLIQHKDYYNNYICPNCNTEYFIDNPSYNNDIDYCQDEGE